MTNIERYKQLENQIKWVQTELKKGEYKAAGIGMEVTIGDWTQVENHTFTYFSFGIYSGIEQELLELILRGLEETKKYILMNIKKESEELTKFLEVV